jgi:DNA polymerase-3 subunit chi
MTEVVFYTGVVDELSFVTKLSEKILKVKRVARIATRDAAHSKEVSNYLWSHQPTKFIPHNVELNTSADDKTALDVSHDTKSSNPDILINLTETPPDHFSSFNRLVEVVSTSKKAIEIARQRFKWYRDRGYKIKVFKM